MVVRLVHESLVGIQLALLHGVIYSLVVAEHLLHVRVARVPEIERLVVLLVNLVEGHLYHAGETMLLRGYEPGVPHPPHELGDVLVRHGVRAEIVQQLGQPAVSRRGLIPLRLDSPLKVPDDGYGPDEVIVRRHIPAVISKRHSAVKQVLVHLDGG